VKPIKLKWADLRKHRLALILLLLTVAGIGAVHLVWVAPAMDQRQDLWDYMGQQKQLIKKYEEKLAEAEGLKVELQMREQELKQLQEGLFQADDPYQLAANLAEPFSESSEDLVIKSYQVVSTKEYGLYQEARLRFSFTTTISGLHEFLESLQKHSSAVQVEKLDIRSVRRKNRSDLIVNVVLAALMEKGGKS